MTGRFRFRSIGWLCVVAACGGDASAQASTTAADSSTQDTGDPLEVVDLPAPRLDGDVAVERALSQRASVRAFAERALTTEEVSQLLWAADGINRESGGRTAPSAGATYPIELYVVTPEQLLHYLPDGHRVEVLAEANLLEPLRGVAQDFVADGAVAFVVTAVFARTEVQYGDRAERFVHLEAGHVAQNLLLQAVALELGAVPIGGFDDAAVTSTLGLPDEHAPLYLIPVGEPAAP
jgi:SagB-type dehydrogenase family enzyme